MTPQETQNQIDVAVIKDWRKSVDKNLKDLNKKVDDLPDTLMALLDERYARKEEVAEIKETVAPITAFRRKIWAWVVFVVFAVGIIETLIFNYIKENVK